MILRTVITCCLAVTLRATDRLEVLRNLDLQAAPHNYYERETTDRFAALQKKIDDNSVELDRSSEKAFLVSLLQALEVPVSSQMLVFSTTSLQLSLITPSNPRALYFNEDTYVGFIPRGKIEIISIDPELGGIFYILDIPKKVEAPLVVERSRRCMNCHSGSESGYVPGLVIKSVVPTVRGGSLDSFRVDQFGHSIPLSDRFGGWYLTDIPEFTNHWGNAIGRAGPGETVTRMPVLPGERFSFSKYPATTSDLLPQLIHEHQAGFVNRVLQAGYVSRSFLHESPQLNDQQKSEVQKLAGEIVDYILFRDEALLPPGGVKGDQAFIEDFRSGRKTGENGSSLKDFDLQSRLFKFRCSYMVYSPLLASLPREMKSATFARLQEALREGGGATHIPEPEKKEIRAILRSTHPELRGI